MRAHLVVVALLAVFPLSRPVTADDDDDNKPYKFGFNIEKYQHRLEEKDKKGLIKGEFGFVTGDGVYHETAYATDENGDFKILGMRSYFVGLPGVDLPDITKGSKPAPPPVRELRPKPVAATILSGIMGCSGCTIPDRSAQAYPSQSVAGPSEGSPGPGSAAFGPDSPFSRPPSAFGGPGGAAGAAPAPAAPAAVGGLGGRPSYVPVDDTHSNIKVGGFTADEMLALLYRFKYTVGFHGHHEVGDRAGHKKGGYHFNGRDGLARHVAYTANEYGFQPNITLHELTAPDTPREDTERAPEFGLKDYEFVWFNAPARQQPLRRRRQGNQQLRQR